MDWIIIAVAAGVVFACTFAFSEWAARRWSKRSRPLSPGDPGPWDEPSWRHDRNDGADGTR